MSEETTTLTPSEAAEKDARWDAAWNEWRDAREAFTVALRRLEQSAEAVVRVQATADEPRREAVLVRLVAQSRSTCSGGPYTDTNIEENAIRQAAIEALRKLKWV